MKAFEPYVKVIALAVVVLGLLAVVQTACETTPRAIAGQGGIQDSGVLAMQTHKKLDEVNATLAGIDKKMQSLLDLLKSGKVCVVVSEAPAPKTGGK